MALNKIYVSTLPGNKYAIDMNDKLHGWWVGWMDG